MSRIKFMTGKLSVLEELKMYKAMNAGPFQMYAPSLSSRKTADPASGASSQAESSASSPTAPAAPGAAQAGPPSEKG
jgi:hypothetical protein